MYGGVGWFSGFPNVAALEASQQAIAADAGWAKEVDKAGSAYSADLGATTSLILRRIA